MDSRVVSTTHLVAKGASLPYRAAKMAAVEPAGIPVIRMQTLVSVVSRWSGLSSTHSRSGYRKSRRQVQRSPGRRRQPDR